MKRGDACHFIQGNFFCSLAYTHTHSVPRKENGKWLPLLREEENNDERKSTLYFKRKEALPYKL